MSVRLSPVQHAALDELTRTLRPGRVVTLAGTPGGGKSSILREAHGRLGGALLASGDVMRALEGGHPLAVEETVHRLVVGALAEHDTVLVDDFHLVASVLCCGHAYPRMNLLYVLLTALSEHAAAAGKRLVLGAEPGMFMHQWRQGTVVQVGAPGPADYRAVCAAYLDTAAVERIDFDRVFRFARKLSARQLRRACESLPPGAAPDTDAFVDHLRASQLASNVDLGEVQPVELHELKGMDDLIRALEANVILPLENAEVAAEFGLTPKRGVLLAGPPGTGKTTVGRALAHRLRSKFFLIDGTVISGTGGFYQRITEIFEAARQNAPAIVFIDDSDVIFEEGGELGLYRYLLTILDGLESESAGRICLMMTAMDVGSMPPALVRSGRIELWLETRLPDEEARTAILKDRAAELPASVGSVEVGRLAAATEGLTGADLKRLMDDGKILFAYDRAQGVPMRPATDYFLQAIETVRANKERYAVAEARARARRPARPAMFGPFSQDVGFAFGMGEEGMALPASMFMSVEE